MLCDGLSLALIFVHKVQLGGSDLPLKSLNRVLDGSVGSSLSRRRVLHHDLATSQL